MVVDETGIDKTGVDEQGINPLSEAKPTVTLCYLNAWSLMPKIEEVRALLSETKCPTILGLGLMKLC